MHQQIEKEKIETIIEKKKKRFDLFGIFCKNIWQQ